MARQAAVFDVATMARALGRFDFICRYVAHQTQRSSGRDLVSGMYVRETRHGFVYGFADLNAASCRPATADVAYDMIRRTPLAYYVRQAEELRIAALS